MGRYGLIGRKLGHSFSPAIHAMIGDYEYKLYPLEPEELEGFVRSGGLDGFNVTIPYKQAVMPHCDELTEQARSIGSVNTMVRTENGWLGDNTDYAGFVRLLGDSAERLAGKKAIVLGSGGASRTVCAVLKDKGIEAVVISRQGEDNYDNLDRHADARLIVNSTPVGMYPDNGRAAVDLSLFPDCELVLDLIYNPARTALILQAESLGIECRSGMLMLAAQAVAAAERFFDTRYDSGLADSIAAKIAAEKQNIVLIGMPGCGKTTVARELSKRTDRPIYDTDDMIVEKAGMSIPEIFKSRGEAGFRALETEILRKISAESGLILATGGGVVTVPENRPLIRQNSVCVFLER
ncbi:MAG: shikimate kinase, partial [Oscillospiraceae bacterium]|nr:shikimate kinase [Oscillospiraceae bacterium]